MRVPRSIVGVSLAVVAVAWVFGSNVATSAPPDEAPAVVDLLIEKNYEILDLPVWRNANGKTFDPKPLIELMMLHIDQDSWKREGARASFPNDRTLVIDQTETNHELIAKFFHAIREAGSETKTPGYTRRGPDEPSGKSIEISPGRGLKFRAELDKAPSSEGSIPSAGLPNGRLLHVPPQVTEYQVKDIKGLNAPSVQDTLNQAGGDRWELVNVSEGMLIFKRPKIFTFEEVEAYSKGKSGK